MAHDQTNPRWDIDQARQDIAALGSRARGSISIPSRSSALHAAKQVLVFLIPSPIQNVLYPSVKSKSGNSDRPRPTAWLDGMRGVAAFLVFFYHVSFSMHDVYTGWSPGHHDLLRLPFIKSLYNGPAMVSMFFVLSGYALSYKPVKQMRNGEHDALFSGLSSSVFRRAIRLYLPCVASTLMIVVLVRLGLYDRTMELANDTVRLPNTHEHHAFRYDTVTEQFWVWLRSFVGFINPFSPVGLGKGIYIDGHLWTIPVEFVSLSREKKNTSSFFANFVPQRASIFLYVTQLGLSRLRPFLRMIILMCLIIWTHGVDYWAMTLFYAGFFMAELDIRRSTMLKTSQTTGMTTAPKFLWSVTYVAVFVFGVFLASQPERNTENTAVWSSLIPLIPEYIIEKWRYYTSWSAILIVWSTSNHRMLQRIFNNSFSQYLGKISFSLYLIHGSVIHTLGYSLLETSWRVIGEDRKETCFVVMAACVTVVSIWWADVFVRLVDVPSVTFARWLEGKCIAAKPIENKEIPAWRDASALV
jgi:peptidoglycan/LPS O-acetylase OafA/YrhL